MKLLRLILLLLTLNLLNQNTAISQSEISLDSLKGEIIKMNKTFDSSYFLQFKVRYIYNSTNPVNNKKDFQQKEGTYLVKGKSFYFDLGDVEYLQDDSMAITALHNNKLLNVSKTTLPTASSSIQLKSWVDKMINSYQQYYNFLVSGSTDSSKGVLYARVNRVESIDSLTMDTTAVQIALKDSLDFVSDIRTIVFNAKDSSIIGDSIKLPYKKFSISFSSTSYRMQQMEFNYQQPEDEMIQDTIFREGIYTQNPEILSDTSYIPDSSTMRTALVFMRHTISLLDKTMSIVFSDYKYADINPNFFRKERFIYFDKMKKKYKAVNKYQDYILNFSGFEQNGEMEDENSLIEGNR